MASHVKTSINNQAVEFLCETQESLLTVLRDRLQLTGTKEGCATGDCGACSVMLDDRLVCSCLVLGVEVQGKSIATVEGVAEADGLHLIQEKLLQHAALQCGICTPGLWWRLKRCLRKIITLANEKYVFGWRVICVVARVMTKLFERYWMLRRRCEGRLCHE